MNEQTIVSMALCTQCKHFTYFDEDITECELGRHTEHSKACKNNYLTTCEYWEAQK